jgi:hypothetical protein
MSTVRLGRQGVISLARVVRISGTRLSGIAPQKLGRRGNKIMEKEIIILNESLLRSWAKDFVSFGGFGILLYFNHRYFGDHAIVAFMFVIGLSVMGFAKNSSDIKKFNSIEEAKKYINEL